MSLVDKRDIVITLPEPRQEFVLKEIGDALDKPTFAFDMGRVPREVPGTVYVAWDGFVQVQYDVLDVIYYVHGEGGHLLLVPVPHPVPHEPIAYFRGFRWYDERHTVGSEEI